MKKRENLASLVALRHDHSVGKIKFNIQFHLTIITVCFFFLSYTNKISKDVWKYKYKLLKWRLLNQLTVWPASIIEFEREKKTHDHHHDDYEDGGDDHDGDADDDRSLDVLHFYKTD